MIEILITLIIAMSIILGISIIFNFIVITKVPFSAFLKASRKGRILLIHPDERRKMKFTVGQLKGSAVETKYGFYDINPNDVFIEEKSKSPVAIVYGMMAPSINPILGGIVRAIKRKNINNYDDLEKYAKDHPGAEIKINEDEEPKSIPVQEVVKYFNRNDRADLMEAEHQFRIAQTYVQRETDWNKWIKVIIALSVFLIFAAIGYAIIVQMGGLGGNEALSQAIQQLTETTRVLRQQNVTGTVIR